MSSYADPKFSDEDVSNFARHMGLNESDVDLFWESYYDYDTELNFIEEEYARAE